MSFNSCGELVVSLGYGPNPNFQTVNSLKTPSKRSVFNRWDDKVFIFRIYRVESDCN